MAAPRTNVHDRSPAALIPLAGAAVLMGMLFGSVLFLHWMPQMVVVASVMIGLAFFVRPQLSLMAFFGLRAIVDLLWWLPFSFMGLNVMELFSGGAAALALVLFYLELRRFENHPAIPTFAPYLIIISFTAIRDMNLRDGLEILARYMSPFLFMFVVTAFFDTRKKRREFFLMLTVVCAIPILASLYHLLAGQMNSYSLDGYNRLIGGYKNLHTHALMMMFITSVGLFWVQHVRRMNFTVLFAAYTGLAVMCLYFSYVRTAMLGLAIGGLVFLWAAGRTRLLMVALFAGGLLVLTSDTIQDRFSDLTLLFSSGMYADDRGELGSGRLALWSVSMKEYLKYPFGEVMLGLGLGKHAQLTAPFFTLAYLDPKIGEIDPHNDYLSLLYQMGPIAPLAYIAIQAQVVRYGLRLRRVGKDQWARDFGAFMVAMSATAFATNSVSNAFISRVTLSWFYWGLAGILFGEAVQTFRELKQEKQAGPKVEPDTAPEDEALALA